MLYSKHRRKETGHPWLAREAGKCTWRVAGTFPFWTSAVLSTPTSVSNLASSRALSGITPVLKLISLDVDNGFSKENRVACVYSFAPAHAPRLPFSSRPRVLHRSIQKTPLENGVSSSQSKAERLETSLHSNPLPVANLVLPHSKTKRM